MVLKSPGIAVREVDATIYPATIDSSIVGIVGFADKGPENVATLVTSPEQLVKVFGEPNDNLYGQGLIAALEILEATNRIYYVRAASGDVEASTEVPLATCPYVKIYNNNFFGVDPIAPALRFTLNLKENGTSIYSTTLTLPATSSLNKPYNSFFEALQSVFGDGTSKGDSVGIALDPEDNSIVVHGVQAGHKYTLEVTALSGAAGNTPVGLLTYVTGTTNTDPVTGGAFVTPPIALFGANPDLVPIAGGPLFFTSSCIGYGTQFDKTKINYLVKSLYGGPGYNLGVSLKTGEVTGLSVEVDNTVGPWFNIFVNDKGYVNESFRVSFYGDKTFLPQVIKESETDTPLLSEFIKGSMAGISLFDINVLSSVSQKLTSLLGIVTNTSINTSECLNANFKGATVYLNPRCVKLLPGTYPMAGGAHALDFDNGDLTTLAGALIGDVSEKTGIYALDDDNLNISMALVPGVTQARVQNALITLAESSQNFIAAVAPPFNITSVQKAVDWMNGKNSSFDRRASINSSYVAVYWPWVQIFNTYSETDIWLDPAVYGIRQMAYTDAVAEPWYAPAGFNRGRLTKPLDTELILSVGDRDSLYENNINPMVKFFPEGITIFGQKTAKRLPSATDRINVRRLMIQLRKTLLASTRSFIFEPNDALTWEGIKTLVDSILRDIAVRRGIAEYRVLCDGTVNTPLRISRRELWCKIILRPVEAAEYIIFEVNLTNNTSSLGA